MRTQILNWRQRCRNHKVGTAVGIQPGQKPPCLCQVRVAHPPSQSRSGFRPGLEPNRTAPPATHRTAGSLPGPIANITHQVGDLEWTEDEQAELQTIAERYTSHGPSGAWRVHRGRVACFSLVLGDTEDLNDISGKWYDEWPLDTWVYSQIFRWLRETVLRLLVNESVEYPEPDKDKVSNEALLHKPESHKSTLPHAPPPQKAMLFCLLSGQVCHLKWWLTKFFADHLDIFYMYAEMGNKESTEMQLKFQDSPNPSVFVTTPKVGGTGLNLTAANHAVMTQKFWVLNEPLQAVARVVRLGQNRVPHTWLLNTGPNGYDNRASDLHQLSEVAQMRVLHGLMNGPNIMIRMIYGIL